MEKIYTKPQVEAKNASSGSYVAGCPQYQAGVGYDNNLPAGSPYNGCRKCECAK